MTTAGGTDNFGPAGTIFSYDIAAAILNVLYAFTQFGTYQQGSLMQASNGKLYGMTEQGGPGLFGTIFSFNPVGGAYNVIHAYNNNNGSAPKGNLIQASNGKLYGMTATGGINGFGTAFSFDLTGGHSTLFHFNGSNAKKPYGSFVQAVNGKLYGLTSEGGNLGFGNEFSFFR